MPPSYHRVCLIFLLFIFIKGDRQINLPSSPDSSLITILKTTPMPESFIPLKPLAAETEPIFDSRLPANLSVPAGGVATLRCRVFNRGHKTVSWLREDRTQILAAGSYTYISDNRYTASKEEDSGGEDTWSLTIRNVSIQDSGVFECQLSSVPVLSYPVRLEVLELGVEILGDDDLYVQAEGSLNITCLVTNIARGAGEGSVVWRHRGGQRISYRSFLGDSPVSIYTDQGDTDTVSTLIIHKLNNQSSGQFSCSPDKAGLVSTINVHVLREEAPSKLHVSSFSSKAILLPLSCLLVGVITLGLSVVGVRSAMKYRSRQPSPRPISLPAS